MGGAGKKVSARIFSALAIAVIACVALVSCSMERSSDGGLEVAESAAVDVLPPPPTSSPARQRPQEPTATPELAPTVFAVPRASFREMACDEVAVGILADRCGVLQVRETPTTWGRTLSLPVAIFSATGSEENSAGTAPVVYLHGGPGHREFLAELAVTGVRPLPDINVTHDVIVINQRGSSVASGDVPCPISLEVRGGFVFPELRDSSVTDFAEAVAACTEEVAENGADPSAYGTTYLADDVASLASALDLDRINVYGISYGGRTAQALMIRHPELLRSVILDSPLSINTRLSESRSRSFSAALGAVSRDCSATPQCAERFPDLQQSVIRLIDSFNSGGVVFTSTIFDRDGQPVAAPIQGSAKIFLGADHSMFRPSTLMFRC